ncbi:hypothetical protein C5167_045099 [Papaver somniferum]|uniref:Uncharacterized protein n=1 Tax=Papaver somniferum TaxID=3469 RepID=A0A4Y7LCP3_PAPSO|nr:hypothetical protein C5167_045099 [Papaver somniferum]
MSTSPSTMVTSSSLETNSVNEGVLDRTGSGAKLLSKIINAARLSCDDPSQSRVFDALAKLLCESSPDKATRSEIFSQLDPSINLAFERLVCFSETSNTIRALSQQVTKLKGDLLAESVASEYLRFKNQELRASDESHQLIIKKLKSDLSKAQKKRGELSVKLSSTQEKARRRCSYLEKLMEVDVGNTKKSVARDIFIKYKSLTDKVFRAYSIPF